MISFVTKPKWLRKFYGECIWEIKTPEKALYLTFDDGPEPIFTDAVLNILNKHSAKATFFCIGKKAEAYPQILNRIISEGHAIGNHSYSHLDGWKTRNKVYFNDIKHAAENLETDLFRPPYGHITSRMSKVLKAPPYSFKIVLWDVLSADFDPGTTPEKCLENVLRNATQGSVILFHDTRTASLNLNYSLPKIIEHFHELGYSFKKLV